MTGPFAALGLPASPSLTDDEVRTAWRRVAAATHPDRPDGGDPDAFAAAAAAYTVLRTRAGRDDALTGVAARLRGGRPGGLIARLVAVAATSALAISAVGWQPATFAVMTGALTWLVVTSISDLAPPAPGRRR